MGMALKKDSTSLIEAILGKDWAELEALEFNGTLLFPEEVVRRRGTGWERIPILLKIPREPDTRKARVKARAWAAKEGLSPELDSELFENMDAICILSDAIRNVSAPHEPWEPFPHELEAKYDRACLDALYAKLEAYRTVIDPRPDGLTEEQLLAVIGAVAKSRNIVPLAGFAGESQNSCVVSMAVLLRTLLASKSSSELSELWMQAHSPLLG